MSHSEKLQPFDLSQFKQKIKPEEQNALEYYAYRMDGDQHNKVPHMAESIDLKPACCDYLYINDRCKEIILIEDTHFKKTVDRITQELGVSESNENTLNEQDNTKIKFIKKLISKENYLKVYGSCIILDRLKLTYKQFADTLVEKDLVFWFIINDDVDNIPAIDNIIQSWQLKQRFASLVEIGLVKKTKVLILKQLKEELRRRENNKEK